MKRPKMIFLKATLHAVSFFSVCCLIFLAINVTAEGAFTGESVLYQAGGFGEDLAGFIGGCGLLLLLSRRKTGVRGRRQFRK